MQANPKTLRNSAMYIGYHILKEMKKQNKDCISIYEASKILKKQGIISARQITLGLSFLYSVGIIDFEEARIWIVK